MCVRCVCVAVFSNIVVEEKLRALAEADERSVVKQVQEFYADFYAINPDLFTLNLGQTCVAPCRSARHVLRSGPWPAVYRDPSHPARRRMPAPRA